MASILFVVLNKLSTIIVQEIEFLGGLRGELQSIGKEFEHMQNFLERSDLLVEDHPDIRCWVDQVRDVAYDVEDLLDEFVMICTYSRSTMWYGVFGKIYAKSVGSIKVRHELATRIKNIKKRIEDVSTAHIKYDAGYPYLLPETASSSAVSRVNNMHYDKRSDALFLEEADLVGIDVSKTELAHLLLNGDIRRNVFSVIGMGGLGKTTLVKKVYDDVSVRSQFNHHAWINVSESFNLEELFKDVIRQLFNEEHRQLPQELEAMNINDLKLAVKDFLQTKKYIVVFDDVWQLTHWNNINLAFPRNQLGSRVVITTRNNELGQAASKTVAGGSMYCLKPLLENEASLLFCRKAFSGDISCPEHLNQVCKKILSACQGLPLAIEVIGSVLARRSQTKEEWELFYNSLGTVINSELDMVKVLSLSYYDLPNRLKICFLYLSIFPEDSQIDKNYLVQLWIAEGFIEWELGMTVEEVADRYLNQLIDRCLVQVERLNQNGRIETVRVHDIIRHIIILKATEQNATTIFHGEDGESFQKNVRRLAIHGSINDNLEHAQIYCKSIRTLVLFKNVGGKISEEVLSKLLSNGRKLLKVLHLKGAQLERIPDEIFELFHLKYLNLKNTKVKHVPKSIGMLQSLQTLNLLGTGVTELPVEIRKLQKLRHLTLGRIHEVPGLETFERVQSVRTCCRIGNLKFLQKLKYIEADQADNGRTVTEIRELRQLRRLGITKLKKDDGKELCSSLGFLKELRELTVYAVNEEEFIDFDYLEPSYLPSLQILTLAGRLERYPEWISYLHGLTEIKLRYSKLSHDPLRCLQDLPNLITVYLISAYQGGSLCFKADGFLKLKNLYLILLQELRRVSVEENALPFLQQLRIRDCLSMIDIPTGIENLMRLQDLEFSNMSKRFGDKVEKLDKQSAAYKKLLQIPFVSIAKWTGGR